MIVKTNLTDGWSLKSLCIKYVLIITWVMPLVSPNPGVSHSIIIYLLSGLFIFDKTGYTVPEFTLF